MSNAPKATPDPQDLEARIVALETENAELRRQLAMTLAAIADLKAQLGQNSKNSSRSPSTDGPGAERQAKKAPSGRKPGGQPGHEAHLRKRVPRERVNKLVVLKPDGCKDCGGQLEPLDDWTDWHQVFELPEIKPFITEFELRSGWCPCCERRTQARLPADVPRCAFGLRLQSVLGVLTGRFRITKREAVELLSTLFGVEMSEGSVTACEKATSETMAGPVEEALQHVRDQRVVHVDETGWREHLEKAWLWVAVTAHVTVFLIHRRRGTEAARALLGAFQGFLISDRWSAYNDWWVGRRQLCWAHLIRHFVAMSELTGAPARIGKDLLEQAEILKLFPAMWAFAKHEGIEPTNNAAEQAIRPGVFWRKGSFGTHSAEGSRFAERMMTVAATLKQQGRSLLDFVVACRQAALHGCPAP